MPRRTTDAANALYQPIETVELSGVSFPVYGSMTWTVAEAKKHPWEEIRTAYISLTGDTRENVNRDQAANVVAGQLQYTWARLKDRTDLVPTLESNQKARIEQALTSTEAAPRAARTKKTTVPKPQPVAGDAVSDETPKEPTAQGDAPADDKSGRTSIPTRGSMGKAAELIAAGELNEDVIVAGVQTAFPETKNTLRHVRYTAKLMKKTLVRSAKPA